jgi:N-acetylglucosamine malate deacetylase 1
MIPSNELFPNLPDITKPLDILVVAPHPDDAELGMGGAIRKFIQQGKRVGIVDLTNGEPTPFGSPEIRARETMTASEALGIRWRLNLGMRNRFLEASLDNRHRLASLFRLARPRWLFAPYWSDAHPDHTAATELVEAARFWSKLSKSDLSGEPFHPQRIFYYYCIHLKMVPQPAFILDISEQWDAKAKSIEAYQSQFVTGRDQEPPGFIERLREEAGFWGKTVGKRYGEPFASKEPIALESFDSLF